MSETQSETKLPSETVATVEKWYDPAVRSWVVQSKDAEGNQVGNATFVYTRREAEEEERVRRIAAGLTRTGVRTEELTSEAAMRRRLRELLGIGYTVSVAYETTNLGRAVFKLTYGGVA